MFDVMTLFKPIHIVAQEPRNVSTSFANLFLVFLVYFIGVIALTVAFNVDAFVSAPLDLLTDILIIFPSIFFFIFVAIPISSISVFLLSRIFSKTGNMIQFLSVGYFLASASSLFALVIFVPFAEFAGLILLFLGIVLFLYFLNEVMETMFAVSPAQSLFLLLIYLAVPTMFMLVVLTLFGSLDLLAVKII